MLPSEHHAVVVTELYKAWNWGRLGSVLDLLHPDVQWSDGTQVRMGMQAVERDLRSLMGVLDATHHLQRVTPRDGRMLANGVLERAGSFPEPFFHLYDLHDGLITRRQVFATMGEALEAAAFSAAPV